MYFFAREVQAVSVAPGNVLPETSNQQPVTANHDYINMIENSTWTISVTNNDYGLSEGISKLEIIEPPRNGKARVTQDNSISYTPDEGYIGQDRLKYRICNTDGQCDEAGVFISVEDYDFVPQPVNDTVIYYSDSSAVYNVLDNDKYIYDKPLQLSIIRELNNGFSEITSNLKIRIKVTSYFLETDSLIYQVCDKEGDCGQAVMYVMPHHDASSPLIIPEGFSPNGDGFNDTFRIPEFDNYQNLSISVFNRNGIIVFESQDYDNCWDGMSNTGPIKGEKVPPGIYYYVIKNDESNQQFNGSVYVSY
jgi:gliding motility-associated-like protein